MGRKLHKKIIAENLPNLGRNLDIQVSDACSIPKTSEKERGRKKNCQPKILGPAKLSFRNDGVRKTFPYGEKAESPLPLDLPYKNC